MGRLDLPVSRELPGGSMLMQLAWINVALAVFNMLPAFPMDGGRVLRAVLALRLGHARATQLAATIGQGLALVFGLVGLFVSPMLIFVALFVWLGAAGEGRSAMLTSAMEGLPVELAMVRDVHVLAPHATLADAVELVLEGFQQDFPVTVDGRLVGVLTRADLLRALTAHGPRARVEIAMHRNYGTAEVGEMLSAAHERLLACDCPALPVTRRDGRVVGMLTHDSVGELLLIQAALRDRTSAGRA